MSCLVRPGRLILLFAAMAAMVGLAACERSKADVVKATPTSEITTEPDRGIAVGTLPEVTPTVTPTEEVSQLLPTPKPQTPPPATTTVSVAPTQTPAPVVPPAVVATPTATPGAEGGDGGASLPREPRYHIVQRGEWVYSIARRYGVSPEAIIRANNLRPPNYIIVPGQRLIIPEDGGAPPPAGRVHVVKAGETLYSIAVRYGTTVEAIKRANGLRSNIIYVGQRLIIPSGGGGGR